MGLSRKTFEKLRNLQSFHVWATDDELRDNWAGYMLGQFVVVMLVGVACYFLFFTD